MKDLVDADRDLRGVFVSNVIMAEGASTLDTGANIITKANLSSARSQELLNPKIN